MATSSLDLASEREICNTIVSLKTDHTIICASHRSLLIDAADQVIDLEATTPGVAESHSLKRRSSAL